MGQPILAAAAFQAALVICLFVHLFRGHYISNRHWLVYHDAVITGYDPGDPRGLLHASAPTWYTRRGDANLEQVKRMAALNRRLALVEMTKHEFLDEARQKERTTFADGTTVTVDWVTKKVEIKPDL